MWEPGLPAMQAPRSVRHTEASLVQASQLTHLKPLAIQTVLGF